MDSSTEILFTVGQIISSFSTLILLIASIILFVKKKTLATWLILIGNSMGCITYIGSIFLSFFAGKESMDTFLIAQGISTIVQSMFYLIFAIGLILLVLSEFSKKQI
ncbi:hypothetical protein [Winogradskyella ludwigii]|jgi:hypothetical protein|uniref:hypothetical protein n=1 Tax=Winogradskyella ludwigii TaxID=2686076 RepID=UPI0015C9B0F3|nr:hypothetical protein [Winogradskyella ludwigii]